MTYTVTLSDDHPIFREGLISSIEETGEFKVIATGASADDAVRIAAQMKPDLALLDLSMPGGGINAAERISKSGTSTKIAMLTVSEVPEDIAAAVAAGATGYLLKGVSATELRDALHRVLKGETCLPDIEQVGSSLPGQRPVIREGAFEELGPRATDVLRVAARGLSNREIGEELSLQEKTVKHYMTQILKTLKVRNRVEAVNMARDYWRR